MTRTVANPEPGRAGNIRTLRIDNTVSEAGISAWTKSHFFKQPVKRFTPHRFTESPPPTLQYITYDTHKNS
jgi:hypothetical protein